MRILVGALFALFSAFSYAEAPVYDAEYYQSHSIDGLTIPKDSVSFLVLGDWGRNGHFRQRDVARWMDIAMHQLDGDFITTTGDNFYSDGVASVDDPYWLTSFEWIYNGPNLFEPWYPTLGNHDYIGNAQAQIDYSRKSQRWQMPSRYYSKTLTLEDDNTEALLLFIDTNPMVPEYAKRVKYRQTQDQDSATQLAWIERQLSGSSAKWKIVIGHHPLYSSGKRFGTTDGIRQVLESLFERHGVQAYFAGHEHDLQHNQPEGKSVVHFVSGGGSSVRYVKQRTFTQYAEAVAGFMSVSVTSQSVLVQAISADGDVRYQHSIMAQESEK